MSRRRLILVVPVLVMTFVALLVPATALAAGEATPAATPPVKTGTTDGVITGTVKNGTKGGGSVEGVVVTLNRYTGMNLAQTWNATVKADGKFEFKGLPVNDGEAYLVTAKYKDVEFQSDSMIVLSQNPNSTADINVYETTSDPSAITVVSRGVVIAGADKANSALEIFEVVSVDNNSDRAFIGSNNTVLQVPLPAGAIQLIPQPGFNFGQPRLEGTTLVTTGSIDPGSHDAMFAYLVPYKGTKVTMDFGSAMPTQSFSVLSQTGSFKLESPALRDAGTANISGTEYHVLSVDNPVVDDVISVTVSDLPKAGNVDASRGPLYAGVAAGAGVLVAAGLVFQTIRRRRAHAVVAAEAPTRADTMLGAAEDQRLALAAELNQLDEERAAGQIDEETYQQEREEILEELRILSRKLRGLEDAGA